MEKRNLFIFLIIVVILIAFSFGFYLGKRKGKKETEAKYQKKIEEAFPRPPEPEEIFSCHGKITEIKGRILTLSVTGYQYSPLEEPKVEIKKVVVTEDTEIKKQVKREAGELRKLEEEYAKALRKGLDVTPPEVFKLEPIEFSELKIGDKILVTAEENIKGKTEFTASDIQLLSVTG